MPKRSENPAYSLLRESIGILAVVTGTGATAPAIATVAKCAAEDNFAASAARSATGAYTVTLKDFYPRMYPIAASVSGTDGKVCQIVSISAAGVVSLQVRTAAGAAADAAASDDIYIDIIARKNP